MEDLDVGGRIILKWASKLNSSIGRGVCVVELRTVICGGGSGESGNEPSGCTRISSGEIRGSLHV